MNKVLFISHIGHGKNAAPNGVNIKNRHLLKYLNHMDGIQTRVIDTDNWKTKIIPLFLKIAFFSFTHSKIILSINTMSAYRVLQFLNLFDFEKKLLYFVVGGNLHKRMENGEVDKKYYQNISQIFVETSQMQETLMRLGCKNVQCLPNTKYFDAPELGDDKKIQEPLKCFYIGRIHPDKGMHLIFESFETLNAEKLSLVIDFYGPIEKKYEAEFKELLALYDWSRYHGTLDLIGNAKGYDLLAQYDLFVFPTYWPGEGFPGAVLDSFISGVPVLASDWNHNKEVISEGYDGFIFQAKNTEALIEKLKYILDNKELLAEMSRNAQETSKKYKAENVLKVLDDIL